MKTIYKNKKPISGSLEFKGEYIRETEKALLFWFKDKDEELWVPKSQVLTLKVITSADKEGSMDLVSLSPWIVETKELDKPADREPGSDDDKGEEWEDEMPF